MLPSMQAEHAAAGAGPTPSVPSMTPLRNLLALRAMDALTPRSNESEGSTGPEEARMREGFRARSRGSSSLAGPSSLSSAAPSSPKPRPPSPRHLLEVGSDAVVRLELRGDEQKFGLVVNRSLRVIAVDAGTAAARAGLRLLDAIVACDGVQASASTLGALVRGKRALELSVERPEDAELNSIARRDRIEWTLAQRTIEEADELERRADLLEASAAEYTRLKGHASKAAQADVAQARAEADEAAVVVYELAEAALQDGKAKEWGLTEWDEGGGGLEGWRQARLRAGIRGRVSLAL